MLTFLRVALLAAALLPFGAFAQTVDLSVSLTDSPDPLTLDTGNITYSASVYNNSSTSATNLAFTFTAPAASTLGTYTPSSGGSCTPSGQSVTCSWSTLPAFNSRTLSVSVTPTAGGSLSASATATSSETDSNGANNTATAVTTVNASIDLKVQSISDSPDPITLGTGNITYSVSLYNESSSKATNPYVDISIPASSTLVSASANASGVCGALSGSTFRCDWAGDFLAFNSRTVTVVVTPTTGGTHTVTATVGADQSDPDGTDNTLSHSTTVNAQIDLKVQSMSDSPDPITLGTGNITYTVNLYNESTSKATNAFVTIGIPAASTFVSASANISGTCGAESGGTFTCSWAGDFQAFNSRTVTVIVTPTAGGTATLSATVAADQGDPDNTDNTLTHSTTVNAQIDLKVQSMSDSPDPITLGTGNITYTVNLYNESTSKATNPYVTLTLPPASTFVSATANVSGTCGPESGGTLTCSWAGDFAAFNSRTITVVVTPTAGGTATLGATIAGDQPDPDAADNTGSHSTTVNAQIDLAINSMSDSPDPITLGTGNITYSVTIYNESTSKATNPFLTLTIPSASTFVSATANISGTCGALTGQTFTCSWAGDLAAFNTRTVTVVVTPTAGGTATLNATVGADQGDPDAADNSGSHSTTVNAQIDLAVSSVSDTPDPITLGTGNVTYSITIYNESTSKATNPYLTITIPAASTFVSASANVSGTCGALSGSTFTCTWAGDLTAFTTRTVTVIVTPTAGGPATLSATVGGDQPDPDASDQTGTATTTVNAQIDLKVSSISDTPDPITLNTGNITYTINLYNESTSKATNPYVDITIPTASTFVSATANVSGTCGALSGNTFTCNWSGDFNAFTTRQVTVIVTPTSGGTATLSATVGATQPDPDASDNTGTASTVVNAQIDVQLSISDSPDPRVLGAGTVTYTINLYNASTSKATNPVIAITLPASTTFNSATANVSGVCTAPSGGSLTCSWTGDYNAFNSRTATIIVTPTVVGSMALTASVTADQPDPSTSNNSETETTNVNPASPPTISSFSPVSGPAGTTVTITGTNFFSASSVKFNGTSASFTASSNTQIVATVPGGALTGFINVTNTAGNTNSGTQFTVTPAPDLVLTKTASTASTPTSASFDYFLNVSNSGAGAASSISVVDTLPAGVTLNSVSGSGWTCSGTTTITCTLSSLAASTAASTITINVTAPSTGTTISNTATVSTTTPETSTANNSSTVAVGVVGCPTTPPITAPASLCANTTGHSASIPPVPGATYLWTITNGTITAGSTTNAITFDAAGATPLTLNVDVFVTSCPTVSNSVSIPVSNPVATISAGGPTTFCAGQSVTLTANAGSAYLWSNGETTQSINVTTAGSYTVTVTNAAGCATTSPATVVTVNPAATATVTAGGPTTFCSGGSVTLTASAGSSYLWSNGETTSSIAVTSSGSYFVTVTNASGCSATSAPTSVTVNPTPNPTVTTSGPTTFCAGGSVTLSAPGGMTSYLWSNGATTDSITVSAAGVYSVQVSNGSCSATSTPTTVNVNPAPSAAISASGPTTFCSGGSVVLSAPAGMTTYAWSNGATTPSITVTSSGNYSVTVTDGSGCSTTSAATAVTVTPTPVASISASGPLSFCEGGSVTLTAGGTGSYVWSNGATTQSIVVSTSGTFSVQVTNGSCSDTSAPVTVTANPAPLVTITGPTSSCAGAPVTLDAGNHAQILWSTGATTQQITVNPTTSTTYAVTVTSAAGCTTTVSHTVDVSASPTATITAPAGLCTSASNQTASVAAQPGASYAWSITNGTMTSSPAMNQITFDAGATGPVTLNVVVTNGSCVSSGTVSIPVSAPPAVSISGPTTVCPRTDFQLAVPTGFAGYLWSNGATTPSINVSQFETTRTWSVTVTGAGGCSTTVSHVVTLATEPLAVIVGPSSAAHNATGLQASVTSQPGATYDWNVFNGSITSGAGTNAITFSTGASGTSAIVSVRVTIGGCTTRDTHTIALADTPTCPFRAAPQLTAPGAGAVSGSPVSFTWSAVANATGYRLFIDANGSGAQLLGSTNATTTSLAASVPAGSIVAWVEATFDACPSTRSSDVAFTVRITDPCANRIPAALISPVNGTILTTSSVELRWNPSPGAIGYRIWASIDDAPFVVLGSTAETTFQTTISRGTVHWFVESLFEGCGSIESARALFTVPAAPECGTSVAQLVAPAAGAQLLTGSVTFQWSPVDGALSYEVWVALDHASPTRLGTTTQTSFASLVPEGQIEWFVRANLDRCPARDSLPARFTIDLPTSCEANERPIAFAPLDHATVSSPASFSWTEVTGATSYHVFVVRGSQPELLATTPAPIATNIQLANGRMRWFVRAIFGNGCPALDSTERELTVVPVPAACAPLPRPVLSTPGQTSSGVPVLLQWTSLPAATAYELQLSDNGSFANAATLDKGDATSHVLTRSNIGPAAISVFARVRARDSRCERVSVSDWSRAVAIFILPAQSAEAAMPLTSPTPITFPLLLGAELAGQSFVATPRQPWLSVAPSQGIVPPNGISLLVTAVTSTLPVGTNLGAVTVTLSSPAARGVSASATTILSPGFSVSLVTPVTPTPKSAPPPDALIIPAVAHATGINSQFQSDVRVSNTSARLMNYQLTFTPSGDAGITEGKQTTFAIEPGQTIALDDILRNWFGTGSTSTTGSLEIRPLTEETSTIGTVAGGLASLATFASSRTFNITPNGSFGQHIPAVPFANFIGSSRVLSLQQIAQSSRYRTNLGIVEGSGEPATLLVKVFGEDGARLTEFPVALSGGQHMQLNGFLAQQGIGSLRDGRVEVEVTSTTGKITAYASVLDNETSDPLLVTPVTLAENGGTKWVMPGVADLNTGNANWQTDLRVFNAGAELVTATLEFHSQNGGAPKSTTITVPPGQVRQFDKALASLFGVANDGGAVHLSTANATRLVATARTYNQTSAGTYGQFISAVTENEAAGSETRALQLLQIEESSRFRTNVGLAEVTGNPVTLELSVVPPDSKFTAVTQLTLGANEFRQLGSLLKSVGLDETYNARVTVRAVSGTGKVAAYASVIDQLTNDPTYVPAQ